MEELLKNIQLSDKAIELYLRCIGQQPLSLFELYSIMSQISFNGFCVECSLFLFSLKLYCQTFLSPSFLLNV